MVSPGFVRIEFRCRLPKGTLGRVVDVKGDDFHRMVESALRTKTLTFDLQDDRISHSTVGSPGGPGTIRLAVAFRAPSAPPPVVIEIPEREFVEYAQTAVELGGLLVSVAPGQVLLANAPVEKMRGPQDRVGPPPGGAPPLEIPPQT